jgi:excisionase family DNA binding protein
MLNRDQILRLKQALQAHRQSLEELEETLLEFEESLPDRATDSPNGRRVLELLSIPEVCETLGMGKSWTYRRLKSGEIPNIKLGRSIKVKQEDLEEYLEAHRYQPTEEIARGRITRPQRSHTSTGIGGETSHPPTRCSILPE